MLNVPAPAVKPGLLRQLGVFSASALVISNMVGTGIFTSLGFQVGDLPSGFTIMVLWGIGGICALCGALAYAEVVVDRSRA